jgi:hypothetical protein
MELKADGTFQREVTSPFDPKPVTITGRWSLNVPPANPSWLERHGISKMNSEDDDRKRAAGVDPADKTIQWSATGVLTFLYAAPPGTQLAPGAVWTGVAMAPAANDSNPPSPQPQMGIEEKYSIRTHTDTKSGEVFLDLADKVFQKPNGASVAKASSARGETAAGERRGKPATPGTTPTAANPDFLNIEPFVGITLDLPGNWLSRDPDSGEKQLSPVAASAHKPRMPKPNSTWRYVPPGDVQDVHVLVSVQPVIFSPKQLADASTISLDHFAAGFVKTASQSLEAKGYYLRPNVAADHTTIGQYAAVVCTGEMVDTLGHYRSLRTFAIPTESATLVLACCWDPEPGTPWKAIIERACSSFRISEAFTAAKP